MVQTTKWLASFLMVMSACSPAEDTKMSGSAERLDGVWRLVMAEVIRPDGQRVPRRTQESFLLFAGDYYSMNFAGGEAPALFSAEQLRPTDAEKVARYNTLIVNAGRYELSEGVLTILPEFALVPEYVGGLGKFDYTLSRDTLDLEWHTIESVEATPDPSTAAGVRFHYRWTRR